MKSDLLKKVCLAAMVVALVISVAPASSVFAAGLNLSAKGDVSNEKLEKVWARQQKAYQRLEKLFDNSDAMIEKTQKMIDEATANGKDASAVQAALDAFEAAVKKARPIYQSANGIVTSHLGFDANGKVTDAAKAKETVKQLGDKLKEVKSALGGTGKALREAVKKFREENKPERDS